MQSGKHKQKVPRKTTDCSKLINSCPDIRTSGHRDIGTTGRPTDIRLRSLVSECVICITANAFARRPKMSVRLSVCVKS